MKQRKKIVNKTICAFGFYDDGISFASIHRDQNNAPVLGAFEFVKGETSLHSILLKQLSKHHKIKKNTCATYLDQSHYQLLTVEAPSVPDGDLLNALKWSIKDSLNFSKDEATLDVFEVPDQTTIKKMINVVSARKNKISEMDELFKMAKISLSVIDIEELALRNLALLDEEEINGVVVLWLQKDKGKILFIKNGDLHLSRNIEIGYHSIKTSEIGLENIALEVQRSIDYFERHYSHVKMKRMILMPTEEELPDLMPFLGTNVTISCCDFELKSQLNGCRNVTTSNIAKYLLTFGTALRLESND